MKLASEIWEPLSKILKDKLLAKYDPAVLVTPEKDLHSRMTVGHKGFYVTIFDSSKAKLIQVGFMEGDQTNVLDSGNRVVEAVYTEMQAQVISHRKLLTATFAYTCIWDVVQAKTGLAWDENNDGVHLAWGDRYKAMYLPIEIQQMSIPKTEIMNRLTTWGAKLPSNCWRLPEMIVHRLLCDSYTL